jgi:hypothetical protein
MNPKAIWSARVLVLGTALILSGCGGGGDADEASAEALAANSDIPVTATQASADVMKFTQRVMGTSMTTSDQAEPMRLGDEAVQLATSETDEPADI